MRHLLAPFAVLLTFAALPAIAASKVQINALFDAMRSQEMLAAMADEGRAEGLHLQDDMLGGRGGAAWGQRMARIYGYERIEQGFRRSYEAELAQADVAPLLAYFQSAAGQKVIGYEIAGRRAISDPAVEEAGAAAFEALDRESRRYALLTGFIEANTLVDLNVAGAMTSNLAFYRGLAAGGGLDMDEAMMMAEVWGQEAEIRDSSTAWVQAFVTLTYQPLTDDELADYVALSRTKPGRALNRALFAGFYDVFSDVSYDMGEAVARFMATEEL